MRAATMIVGAIAAASILIALAFIISGGDSSKAVTTTVTEKIVEVPKRTEGGGEVAQSAGPTKCDRELSVESVSCEVGEQVLSAYEEGHRGLFFPTDAATGETLELNCGEPTPVICKAVEGPATVIFGG